MKLVIGLVFVLAFAGEICSAQIITPTSKATDGQIKAASELIELVRARESMEASIDLMIKSQIKLEPRLAPLEDVMRAFISKYMSFDKLQPALIKIYTDSFSESELLDLITFYKTATGQKAIAKIPEIFQAANNLGQQSVTEHMGELGDMIRTRLKEIDEKKAKP